MSVNINGVEDLVGQNLTPAMAYAVVNTAVQKLALMSLDTQDFRFLGTLHNNDTADGSSHPLQRLVAYVEVIVNGQQPSGGSLTMQLLIAGVAQTPTFSVTAGQAYALTSFLPTPTMAVAAGAILAAQVVNANGATDVLVRVRSYLVIP